MSERLGAFKNTAIRVAESVIATSPLKRGRPGVDLAKALLGPKTSKQERVIAAVNLGYYVATVRNV